MLVTQLAITSAALFLPTGTPPDVPKASDWAATGPDCKLFAAGDVNGDGYADLITINGNRDLCLAPSVRGWKTAGWVAIASDVNPDALGLVTATPIPAENAPPDAAPVQVIVVEKDKIQVYSEFKDGRLAQHTTIPAPDGRSLSGLAPSTTPAFTDDAGDWWIFKDGALVKFASGERNAALAPTLLDGPPYNSGAQPLLRFSSGFTREGGRLEWAVFATNRPNDHRVVRVAVSESPDKNDSDADGLSDDQEAAFGTNPRNRDTDIDGLLDGWEVHGLPRALDLGPFIKLYNKDASEGDRPAQLNPLRQDVIVCVSYFESVDPKQFQGEMPKVQALYRNLPTTNPDGSRGIAIHFLELPMVPKADQSMPWWDVGNKHFPQSHRGMMHWLQVTPWGGGQSSETADMGGAGNNWAVFAHEFGHQLSLSHTGDSEAAWCPLYPSLMNYAFSYGFDGDGSAIHFSTGEFKETLLDEKHLKEHLPYPYASLKYLANHPFRYTLKDNADQPGGGTLIDWNHNGKFDEGEVEADINYGSSSYCGTRREHELIGSGPCLTYVNDVCYLAAVDQTRDHIWIKTYQGDEKWSDKRVVSSSGTEKEPVLVGGKDYGLLFHHHLYSWHVTRFTDKELGNPVKLEGLPLCDLNACRVTTKDADRVLIVSRHEDESLEYRWLTFKDNDFAKPLLSNPQKFETRSLLAPGLGIDPSDGRLLLVSSMHNSRGNIYCMRITWCQLQGDKLWEQEMKWTRGEGSGNGCCSRPVVAFTSGGQLNIFHQGGPDANGQMIAYRTSKVGNDKLDEGWLTCMLYDVWTRSRVPIAFANGPQGAIFGYRWDAGGKNNNLQTAHNGFGIDDKPMRDFDDGAKISRWGIRHSILTMVPVPDAPAQPPVAPVGASGEEGDKH